MYIDGDTILPEDNDDGRDAALDRIDDILANLDVDDG